MRSKIEQVFLVLALCVLVALPLRADTLKLRDGKTFQGQYLGGTSRTVSFEVAGQVKVFSVDEILSLSFHATQSAATAAPAAGTPPATTTSTATAPPRAERAAETGPELVSVPAGTVLTVRMIDSVDSETNRIGDIFRASLDQDLVVGDRTIARRGTEVRGRLSEAKSAGRIAGKSELQLELTTILIDNRPYPLMTGEYAVAGKSRGGQTAKRVAATTAAGAVIGAIAGGGKGAAIGAGAGAATGTAIQVMTKGEQIRVPSETLLDFRLTSAASLPVGQSSSR